MGNCLNSSTSDDISLLREDNNSDRVEVGTYGAPPPYQEPPPQPESTPYYYPAPNERRSASQLTEEEQIKIAKRIGLIQHIPSGTFDGTGKIKECVICMNDFAVGERLRFLPCLHSYHLTCIDDWLMRSFTCPSCMEPVESALLTTYESN